MAHLTTTPSSLEIGISCDLEAADRYRRLAGNATGSSSRRHWLKRADESVAAADVKRRKIDERDARMRQASSTGVAVMAFPARNPKGGR